MTSEFLDKRLDGPSQEKKKKKGTKKKQDPMINCPIVAPQI